MHRLNINIRVVAFTLVAATFAMTGLSACTAGAQLRGQAKEVQANNESIHDLAYRCAPKEIAIAEAEVDFGLYELSQGNFTRAKEHIFRAERYSRLADRFSDHEACELKGAKIEVQKEEAVQLKDEAQDQDGDGLMDDEDDCPLDPEDEDGFEDDDGCPDEDNDEDGLKDTSDRCPNISEGNFDGYQDEDGCPDPDNDNDGLTDMNDGCPQQPEDFDGYQDEDGCPDRDNDGDGIADSLDQCPDEAEDYDGDVDDDGCPEERKRVKVTKDKIELNEKVHFATAKSEIQQRSYALLNEVADVLQSNPEIAIRIEGHTDSRGGDDYNQKLSQRRAQSVVDFLVDKGIERSRLNAKGFGEERPIESNATEAGRAANRRVEIHITSRE